MGGEKPGNGRCIHRFLGSPPRGRGKVFFKALCEAAFGITPAWAGKSLFKQVWKMLQEDHPRVGGEKSPPLQQPSPSSGSPPRRREKGLGSQVTQLSQGSPPRERGKVVVSSMVTAPSRITPRMGGEKFTAYAKIWNEWGSPPRGRGKVLSARLNNLIDGITPAWAGKSTGPRLL